jgi:uncharacterized protein YbaR (Trm112 family)
MKRRLLDFLVCPWCQVPFRCQAIREDGDDVIEGQLTCDECSHTFPIVRSIPRILPSVLRPGNQATSDAFGWEWQHFRKLHTLEVETNREQFLDWIYPIEPQYFKNKVVLDGGCGMGRFSYLASLMGAKEVIAIDVSEAVEAAMENCLDLSNVHIVQADIYHLPLRTREVRNEGDIDFAFSIGVLHHLPDPEAGFHAQVGHLRNNGSIFAWVYGYENNRWVVRFVNPVREHVTSRLPRPALMAFAWGITLFLQPVLKLFYGWLGSEKGLGWVRRLLPYREYMSWLAQYGFRHTHEVVFDHLVAPTAFYIRREEFSRWFTDAGFEDVTITPRNGNSWRGCGNSSTEATSPSTQIGKS